MSFDTTNIINLIDCYLSKKINAEIFEKEYIKLWRQYRDSKESSTLDIKTQEYLDAIFCSVDSYCSDPSLRDDYDLDEVTLYLEIADIKNSWEISTRI